VKCPSCHEDQDRVIDSRAIEDGRTIRRRRECLLCLRRFTTYEHIEDTVKITVIKKDGSRVPYNRESIINGVQKACYKRPVSLEQIQKLAESVEEDLLTRATQEVSSRLIGELTIARLRQLDKVAYIRYASVYHEFHDLAQFLDEVHHVMETEKNTPDGQQQLFE